MAKQPPGHIDPKELYGFGINPDALKQIERQLAENGAEIKKQSLRKETEKMDNKTISALKDLTKVIDDQKKFIEKIDKSQAKSDKVIKEVATLNKTNNDLLQKSVDLQDRMLTEMRKMNKTMSMNEDIANDRLRSIDKHIVELEDIEREKGGGEGHRTLLDRLSDLLDFGGKGRRKGLGGKGKLGKLGRAAGIAGAFELADDVTHMGLDASRSKGMDSVARGMQKSSPGFVDVAGRMSQPGVSDIASKMSMGIPDVTKINSKTFSKEVFKNMMKGAGAAIKKAPGTVLGKAIPGLGALIAGYGQYNATGSVGEAIAAGMGTIAGSIGGAFIGGLFGGVGAIPGEIAGSLVGGGVAVDAYRKIFGGGNEVSKDIKDAQKQKTEAPAGEKKEEDKSWFDKLKEMVWGEKKPEGSQESSDWDQKSNFKWDVGPENVNMKALSESIKDIESRSSGLYNAKASGSSASGAYQFVDDTWRSAAAGAGYAGRYKSARDAPPEVQDEVFNDYMQRLIKKHGMKGAILTHFTGNPEGKMSSKAQAANPGVTGDVYLNRFEKSYGKWSSSDAAKTEGNQKQETPLPSVKEDAVTNDKTSSKEKTSSNESVKKDAAVGSYPSGDIVALGKALQSEGLDVTEHPAFGGVSKVHKGRGHYEGRAIDINAVHGKRLEASDPVWGPKFDALADKLSSLGYKVFWREKGPYGASGHNNHLHAEVPAGGQKTSQGESMGRSAGTPPSRPSSFSPSESSSSESSNQVVPAMSPTNAPGMDMLGNMSGMMGGIPGMGMLGGMGGIGGMIGGLIGPITGLLGGLFGELFGEEQPQLALETNANTLAAPMPVPRPNQKEINELIAQNAGAPPQRPATLMANAKVPAPKEMPDERNYTRSSSIRTADVNNGQSWSGIGANDVARRGGTNPPPPGADWYDEKIKTTLYGHRQRKYAGSSLENMA